MTTYVIRNLSINHHPNKWGSDYHEVLPYVREAFARSIGNIRKNMQTKHSNEIIRIVRQLCDPDPERRGHPLNHKSKGSSYSLERYVSKLDLLARRTEIEAFR